MILGIPKIACEIDRMQGVSKSSGKLPSEMWNAGKWGEKRREGRVHVDDTEAVLKGGRDIFKILFISFTKCFLVY